jgi:hypothetical protein
MRTYRAELAPSRTKPLWPGYEEIAKRDVERVLSPGPGRHAFETTCPYCGAQDCLFGTVSVGAKERVSGIPMTRNGFEIPDVRERDTEVQIIHCSECETAIDPLAYFAPVTFYADKEGISFLPEI